MSVEKELKTETIKWLERIERKIKSVEASCEKGNEFLRNTQAYISDTKYFFKQNDLIRAFECVVWAWAWIEIGLEVGFLREKI
jgi:hypothetical protein